MLLIALSHIVNGCCSGKHTSKKQISTPISLKFVQLQYIHLAQ